MKKINQNSYKQALRWIFKILKKEKIKFNVLGGLAAYTYGSKRMLVDIDFSMSHRDMIKLAKVAENYVVERPWNGTSSTSLWRGYYMELSYKGIAIEIGEAKNTEFFNTKTKKWEKFPDGLKNSVNKKIFGIMVPVMPKKNLISYKSKLNREVDIFDVKNMS